MDVDAAVLVPVDSIDVADDAVRVDDVVRVDDEDVSNPPLLLPEHEELVEPYGNSIQSVNLSSALKCCNLTGAQHLPTMLEHV